MISLLPFFIINSAFAQPEMLSINSDAIKRKPWRPFQTEGTYEPPKVFYGKRGGRYRIRYNNNGEPYRDYF